MNRRTLLLGGGGAAAVCFSGLPAMAGKPAVFTGLVPGVGAGGYDLTAYLRFNEARVGDPAITAMHDGVTYRFADEAGRAAFLADPSAYLPAFGGYCAYAVANGYTAKIDPEAFTVAGGRLFLNFSLSVRARWLKDIDANIAAGDRNWPGVLDA
jgi:hypothetical protein